MQIEVKFLKGDQSYIKFDDYSEVIRYMMAAEIPWKIQKPKGGTMPKQIESYKRRVRGRAIIVHGDKGSSIRVLSDSDFVHDLHKLGEISDIRQSK